MSKHEEESQVGAAARGAAGFVANSMHRRERAVVLAVKSGLMGLFAHGLEAATGPVVAWQLGQHLWAVWPVKRSKLDPNCA